MSQSAGLVQGGSFSTREQFPWLVLISVDLKNDGKFVHSGPGSLISMKHVLVKAASICSAQAETKKLIAISNNRVRLFLGTLKSDEATASGSVQINGYGIAEIIVHPDALGNLPRIADIAIFKLKNRLQRSNFISPVCLWTGSDEIDQINNKTSYGVGYGRDESGKNSEIRKHVRRYGRSTNDDWKLESHVYDADIAVLRLDKPISNPSACRQKQNSLAETREALLQFNGTHNSDELLGRNWQRSEIVFCRN